MNPRRRAMACAAGMAGGGLVWLSAWCKLMTWGGQACRVPAQGAA